MNELKNRIKLIIICALLFLSVSLCLSSCLEDGNAVETEDENRTYQLYLDIDFNENWFFNKYDVEAFFDDEAIGTLIHGQIFTKLIEVKNGIHILKFVCATDKDISNTVELKTKSDTTFSCTIVSEKDTIRIKSPKTEPGLIGAFITMPDVTYWLLSDAEKRLQDDGFVNVSSQSADGDSIIVEGNWLVQEQTVEAGSEIDKNAPVELICRKKEKMVKEWFDQTTVLSAVSKAAQYDYSVKFIDIASKLEVDSSKLNDEEKNEWEVISVSDKSGKKAELTVQYTGLAIIPKIRGNILSEARKILSKNHFSNIELIADSGFIWDEDNWYVIATEAEEGALIQADSIIKLYCSKNQVQSRSIFNIPIPLKEIRITNSSFRIAVNDTMNIPYVLYPLDTTETDIDVKIACADILDYGSEGFTGKSEGETTVQFCYGNQVFAECTVTVYYEPLKSIKFKSFRLHIGETITPEIIFEPKNASKKEYLLHSGNEEIIKVIGNQITGMREGKTTIHVVGENDLTSEIEVNVLPVELKTLSLVENEISMLIGEKRRCIPKFEPSNTTNKELEWYSNDERIVTVDEEGNITARGEGKTTVVAKHIQTGQTSSVSIEVKSIPVSKITITAPATKIVIDTSLQLSASVSPQNASDKTLVWSSSNPGVATVSNNGLVLGKQCGTAMITVKSSNGKSDSVTVQVVGKPKTMTVSFSSYCLSNDHVGDSWYQTYSINKKAVSSTSNFDFAVGDSVEFKGQVVDNDSRPDVGSSTVTRVISNEDIQNGFELSFHVLVSENSGRYANHYAEWVVNVVVR